MKAVTLFVERLEDYERLVERYDAGEPIKHLGRMRVYRALRKLDRQPNRYRRDDWHDTALRLRAAGMSLRAIARELGVSASGVCRALNAVRSSSAPMVQKRSHDTRAIGVTRGA